MSRQYSAVSVTLYGTTKGHKPRIEDCVNFNEVSEIQEKYDNKRVMNTALESLKVDYEEKDKIDKLITEQKRNNYKYKDDSAEMDSL
ncbi:MAG: hypothetical protein K2J47_01010 [Ruminococcus sp.]|nr:hypothetical protein [Ruminococcus sp.]